MPWVTTSFSRIGVRLERKGAGGELRPRGARVELGLPYMWPGYGTRYGRARPPEGPLKPIKSRRVVPRCKLHLPHGAKEHYIGDPNAIPGLGLGVSLSFPM
jgi:hypothetical protein